jgi:hypothetical protein
MTWSDADLIETVRRLAAPREEQEAWLRDVGTWPCLDELALEFDDELSRISGPEARQRVTTELLDALLRLDAYLASISGEENARLWQPEALDGPEWDRVRALARRALGFAP